MRNRVAALPRDLRAVSNTVLVSKTRGRETRKPAARSRRRANFPSDTHTLIAISRWTIESLPPCPIPRLLRAVGGMVLQKILVGGFAPAESFFHAVPIPN